MDKLFRELEQKIAVNQDILDSHMICPRDYHEGVIAGLNMALELLYPNKHTLVEVRGTFGKSLDNAKVVCAKCDEQILYLDEHESSCLSKTQDKSGQ